MKHLSIRIYGKVQGVFFRASTKEKADEFNITGSVWNNPEGGVSIEAEGEEEELERFVKWCQQGPKLARVDRCEIMESNLEYFSTFSIHR